jgi:hypothetical protein
MVERFRTLDLRDERNLRRADFRQNLPGLPHVVCRSHEAQGDHVDARPDTELQIVDVFRRQRVGCQLHTGRVDALVLVERAALDDPCDDVASIGRFDLELDAAVIEEQ